MTEQHIHQLDQTDVAGPQEATGVVNVLDDLNRRYQAAFERQARGERVRFGLSLMPMPTEQTGTDGQPQLISMGVLYVEMPGAVLGTNISGTQIIQLSGTRDEEIELRVRQFLADLLHARSQQLEQLRIDAEAAQANGEQPATGGLIAPDRGANPTWDDAQRALGDYRAGR